MTGAKNFVALTRRVDVELATAGGTRDGTLERPVYDSHIIRSHYDATEVVALAREIISADVEANGHQFPAYLEIRLLKRCGQSAGSPSMIALQPIMQRFREILSTAKARISRRRRNSTATYLRHRFALLVDFERSGRV